MPVLVFFLSFPFNRNDFEWIQIIFEMLMIRISIEAPKKIFVWTEVSDSLSSGFKAQHALNQNYLNSLEKLCESIQAESNMAINHCRTEYNRKIEFLILTS